MTKLAIELIASLTVYFIFALWILLGWMTIRIIREWDWDNEDSLTVVGLFILFSATWIGIFWL